MNPHLVESMVTVLAIGLFLGLTALAIAVLPWSSAAHRESQLAWGSLVLVPVALGRAPREKPRALVFETRSVDQLLPPPIPSHSRRPRVARVQGRTVHVLPRRADVRRPTLA